MKKFLRKHHEIVLIIGAIAFSVVLIAYFVWGITTLASELTQALSPRRAGDRPLMFDITGAEEVLQFKQN